MTLNELLGDAYKEGMTIEEVSEALKNVQMPVDQTSEINHLKETISKANSEAKEWKDKYRSTLDEATRKQQEAEENAKKQQEELDSLRKTTAIAGYKASYLAMGYEEKLAEDTANALYDGDNERLFSNQKKHMETVAQRAKEEALRGSGRPGGSGSGENNNDSEAVKLAKEIGADKAATEKATRDGLSYYLGN